VSSQTPTPLVRSRFVVSTSHALSSPAYGGDTGIQTTFVLTTTSSKSLIHVETTVEEVCQTVKE